MQFSWHTGFDELTKRLFVCEIRVRLLLQYLLHHQQGPTDLFVDFSEKKIFFYPFPAKSSHICRWNSNLSSKQSVVYGVYKYISKFGSKNTICCSTDQKIVILFLLLELGIFSLKLGKKHTSFFAIGKYRWSKWSKKPEYTPEFCCCGNKALWTLRSDSPDLGP